MTREEFLDKMDRLFITKEQYMADLQKLLDAGAINYEKMEPGSFLGPYPVARAIYQEETLWYITGSAYENTRRAASREANRLYNLL